MESGVGAIALSEPTPSKESSLRREVWTSSSEHRGSVIEDSVNISSALEQSITGAMAVEVDRVCLVGIGHGAGAAGISNTTNVGTVAGGGALTSYDKILDAVNEILIDNARRCQRRSLCRRGPQLRLPNWKEGVASSINPVVIPPLVQRMTQYITTSLPITGESARHRGLYSATSPSYTSVCAHR